MHCRKLQYNLFAKDCRNAGRFRNPACPEFHLFNGKSAANTILEISRVQSKEICSCHLDVLRYSNGGQNNPMSIKSIMGRTGLSKVDIQKRLSDKSSGEHNGFYGKKHSTKTLAKLAESRAKQCKTVTKPEMALWGILTALNVKFEYQKPIMRYVVDFFIEPDIVIEVFGDYWHGDERLKSGGEEKKDKHKISMLEENGYKVMIFWESEISGEPQKVISDLKETICV